MASQASPSPTSQGPKFSLASFTRASKGLCVVLVSSYLLSLLFPALIPFFALVPGRTIPFAWNLLTCGLLEISIVSLLIDVVAVLFLGRLLEPVWGTKEFIRFVMVVSASSAFSTFVLMFFAYCVTLQGAILYTPIAGFQGVVAGFLVALKQAMPDQELPLPLKIRCKWLPSLAVLAVILRVVLTGRGFLYAPFVLFGTYNAWVYLRFFQTNGEGGLKGDPGDDFAFATFFPEPLRPYVLRVETVLSRLCCGRRQQSSDSPDTVASGLPLPGSHPIEASRRRERGARALEERLSKAAELAAAPEKPGNGDKALEAKTAPDQGDAAERV